MRTMNSSPKPASNTSSGGTRESLQPRIGRERALTLGERGKDFLLDGWESCLAANEALAARGSEPGKRLLCRKGTRGFVA